MVSDYECVFQWLSCLKQRNKGENILKRDTATNCVWGCPVDLALNQGEKGTPGTNKHPFSFNQVFLPTRGRKLKTTQHKLP